MSDSAFVAELKGEWNFTAGSTAQVLAKSQLGAYIAELEARRGSPVEPLDFLNATPQELGSLAGTPYDDQFKIRMQECGSATINYEFWFTYRVYQAEPGVFLIHQGTEQKACTSTGGPPPRENGQESDIPESEPQDLPEHGPVPSFTDCVSNAGKLAVYGVRWLDENAARLVGAYTLPAVREVSTLPRGASAAQIADKSATALRTATQLTRVLTPVLEGPATATSLEAVGVSTTTASLAVVAAGVTLGIAGSCLHNPSAFGDPHLISLDGHAFDLQAAGEFHLAAVPQDGFDVQARFVPNGTNYSVTDAVAVRVGGNKIEFRPNGETLINGSIDVLNADGYLKLDDGSTIVRSGEDRTLMASKPNALVRYRSGAVSLAFGEEVATEGILGDNDGNPANDFVTAVGEDLGMNPSTAVIHGRFADSWRIQQSSSNFTYSAGTSTASYTDPIFPPNIVTLSDFPASELEAATARCKSEQIVVGPALEDCVYDLLVTGDDAYVAAAGAVTADVVDPAAAVFATDGTLTEDFASPVPTAFSGPSYLPGLGSARAVGPLFDAPGYNFALIDVPRHDSLTFSSDLYLFGPEIEGQYVDILVNSVTATRVSFSAESGTATNADDVDVAFAERGSDARGVHYRRFQITVRSDHAVPTLKLDFLGEKFRGVLDTSFALSNMQLALDAPPAQVFGIDLPIKVSRNLPESGAGRLESPGSRDDYDFLLSADDAAKGLVLDSATRGIFGLRRLGQDKVIDGAVVGSGIRWASLEAGAYQLSSQSLGTAMDYEFALSGMPDPQVFAYQIGKRVQDGLIDGAAAAGAGNLETSASVDVYKFSVPAGGRTVVVDSGGVGIDSPEAVLVNDAGTTTYGNVGGHHEFNLPEGAFKIVVARTGRAGDYWMETFVKPNAQVFDYAIGRYVQNGQIGGEAAPGAGNLETTTSQDVYNFTIPTGGRTIVIHSGGGPIDSPEAVLMNQAGTTTYGRVGGYYQYALPEGSYKIVVARTGWPGDYWMNTFEF